MPHHTVFNRTYRTVLYYLVLMKESNTATGATAAPASSGDDDYDVTVG